MRIKPSFIIFAGVLALNVTASADNHQDVFLHSVNALGPCAIQSSSLSQGQQSKVSIGLKDFFAKTSTGQEFATATCTVELVVDVPANQQLVLGVASAHAEVLQISTNQGEATLGLRATTAGELTDAVFTSKKATGPLFATSPFSVRGQEIESLPCSQGGGLKLVVTAAATGPHQEEFQATEVKVERIDINGIYLRPCQRR
jgi:hypothetical protein